MTELVKVSNDGFAVTGIDLETGQPREVWFSPFGFYDLVRAVSEQEWRVALHPIRDDRAAFDASQEAVVS